MTACSKRTVLQQSSSGAGWSEGKLIIKPQSWVWQVKCWVYIGADKVFLKTTKENRSN